MPERDEALARFPRRVRDRLDAFAEAIDGLPSDSMPMYSTRPLDGAAHDAARETADRIADEHHWNDAVAALRDLAIEWVNRRLDDPSASLGWSGTRRESMSTRIDDLALAAQGLSDAFRAVALWDELEEADRDELLGPWAPIVEPV